MRIPPRGLARLACVATMAATLGGAAVAGAQGVHVQLAPGTSEVAPGAVFDLDLVLSQAGSSINGFDAVIGFDPAALTFIPLAPISQQQGTLMTGACGNFFHRFTPTTGQLSIADVMLCAGASVTGPGQIYHLRFQASNTPQVTHVQFLPGLQFYNAGLFVNPAFSTDATIGIGVSLDAGPFTGPSRLALHVAPNPARGRAAFVIELERAGPMRMSVMDVRGRLVRRFEQRVSAPTRATLAWDGRDSAGRQVPAGLYFVTLEAGGRSVSSRVSLVR